MVHETAVASEKRQVKCFSTEGPDSDERVNLNRSTQAENSPMLLLIVLLISGISLGAQVPQINEPSVPSSASNKTFTSPIPTTPPQTKHEMTATDLEAFVDGIIPLQLERSDLAGAVVVVVRDGKQLLSKGYGFADVKKKVPVNPYSTLFRLASISKLFTWISVMQQVEQGKLDLDTDVNRYLDFNIDPSKWHKPVSLRNLMTHTGGFEDTYRDTAIFNLTDPRNRRCAIT